METSLYQVTKPVAPNYSVIFSYEANFEPFATRKWMAGHWHHSVYYIIVYLVLVQLGISLMKNRPGYELKKALFLWNSTLSIFSAIGASRMWPEFIYVLKEFGIMYSLCNASFLTHCKVTSFWAWLFVVSKALELLDTMFIVARKRKVTFLHLYHHCTILFFVWGGYHDFAGIGRWFVSLNYFVHSWMYGYYALRSIGLHLPEWIKICITSMQISQMFLAIGMTFVVYVLRETGYSCEASNKIIAMAVILLASYILLFTKFFYDTYIVKPRKYTKQKM